MTALDFPTSPSNGDTYQNYVYDSTAGVWKRFTAGLDLNDITDVTLTSPTDGQALVYDNATSNWVNGEGSTVPVLISETAPVSPEVGELWLNSTEAKMYVYYNDGTSAQWVAAVGGTVPSQGKILQVVSTTKDDIYDISLAGGAVAPTNITGLEATITPSFTSSKILVFVNIMFSVDASSGKSFVLYRDATPVGIGNATGANSRTRTTGSSTLRATSDASNLSANYLDTPATTSAITYGARIHNTNNSSTGQVAVNRTWRDDNANYEPRGISTITVMEVAG